MANKVMEVQMPIDYFITIGIIIFCGLIMIWYIR